MPETRPRALTSAAAARLAQADVPSPLRDASLLLAHAWGCSEAEVQRRDILGTTVPADVAETYTQLVDERCRRVPVQHLTGRAPFRGLELAVGPGVFVPRPETEMLVDEVLSRLPEGGTVVDLCSGSGALAIAIAAERPDARVIAVELDELAVAWASQNIADNQVNVELRVEDARAALPELEGEIDVVVSNPPYVPTDMVPQEPEVAEYDPPIALFGGSSDGLRLPIEIAERAARLLKPGGALVMEHADVQGATLPKALLDGRGYDRASDLDDAAGRPRVTIARREGGARFEAPTSPAQRPFRTRRTVRLVVVDEDQQVLLLKDSDQGTDPVTTWWMTPGGGVDPGEDLREAAIREMYEETGQRIEAAQLIGPLGARTVIHGYSDQVVQQHDTFYGLRVQNFDVDPAALTPEERITFQGWRWWTLESLQAANGEKGTVDAQETVWPGELAVLVAATLSGSVVELADVEESSVPVSKF